jgi:probable F420-dependent oxidoreductase
LRIVTHPFRFAIQSAPFGDPVALREFAKKLEDLGYAELFSSDHINSGGLNGVDPFLPLLVAAEATSALRFGPLVLNNEFHNPVLLARTAASFDLLSDGRLVLGMGTGYAQDEHDAADIELREPRARVVRLSESVAALRTLLDDGSAHCAGEYITLAVDSLGVRPAQERVPILIGGHGKGVVTIAAQQADIFQFTGLTHDQITGAPSGGGFNLDRIAQRHSWLVDVAGDRLDQLEISTLVQQTHVGDGAAAVRDAAAARMKLDTSVVDQMPFALIGSEAQVIEKIKQLRETFGIHHFVSRDADDMAPVVAALAGQ